MGFQKYAAAEVLSAELAGSTQSVVRRIAHRHAFVYTPREGYLYVRSRAISSRTNDNYDEFPAEEIKKAYKSFVGRPVFVNHHNDDHRRSRGVIIDAALHEDVNPDGSPDTWTEVLMEVDAKRFPLLAKAILAGEIDRTSMGTDVAYSQCTACGNIAKTPLDYCAHIPRMKGLRVNKTTASGEKVGILVAERCYGLNFFENSLLVEDPADPTAFFLGVEAGPGVQSMGVRASIEHEGKDDRFAGVSLKQDDKGWYVATHRARSDSYESPEKIPQKDIDFIESTGARKTAASSHPGQLSPEEFEKMGPWVFHATSDKKDRDKLANEGVRMSNVPNNLARQRYERGEPSEYAPGGGIGKGLYVSKHAWQTTGYGRHLIGISGVQPHELATPPESTVPGGGVEDALNDHNGAMIVKDIPKERVHDFGPIDWEAQPDHWYAVYGARKKGLDVGANKSLYPDMEKRLARKTAADDGPSVAGVAVKAADTGRVLMLQRSFADEDDPARGTWEFPGGHAEGDEGLFDGAVREWQEETGLTFPSGDPGGVWDSGPVYRGFLWIVPSEDVLPIHDTNEREHINPDDPDGDDTESIAWWEPEQLPKNPAVRDEVRKGTDWDLLGVTRPKTARTSEEFAQGVMDEYHRLGKDEHRGPVWRDFGRPNLLTPGAGDAATTDNGFDAYSDGYEDGFNNVVKPMSQKYSDPANADAFWEGYQDGLARRNQTAAGLVTEAKPRYEPGGHPWYQANPVNPQNIIDHFNRATPEDKEQGRRWYSDANLVATAIAGGDAHKGAGVLAAYSPQAFWPTNMFNAARALQTKQAMGGKGSGVFATESMRKQAQAIIDGGRHPEVLKGPKIQDFAHLIEHGGQHPADPTTHVVIDRHALAVAAGKRLTDAEAEKAPLDNRHYYNHVAEQYRQAADQISDMTGEHWEPHQVQAATWLVRQRENAMHDAERGERLDVGREKSRNKAQDTWETFAGEHYPTLAGPGYHAAGLSTEALGEQTAPAEVDTLRDENCPVCGEDDSFNGAECIVCGYVAPPKQFRDPDLSVAQDNDLREDKEDTAAGAGLAQTPAGGKPTIIIQTKGGTPGPTAPNTNTPQNTRPVTSGRRPTIRIITTRQKEHEYA